MYRFISTFRSRGRFAGGLVIVVALLLTLTSVAPTAAHADGDGGWGAGGGGGTGDGDPFSQNCDDDAFGTTPYAPAGPAHLYDPDGNYAGEGKIMYSPNCNANWVQVSYDPNQYYLVNMKFWIAGQQGSTLFGSNFFTSNSGQAWTWMRTGMANRLACGSVTLGRNLGNGNSTEFPIFLGCS
jgi:hypothetical protein